MKGKLIKGKKQYSLLADKKNIGNFDAIETSLGFIIADEFGVDILKLSKQNCDEIFGVIDVVKLAEEKYPYEKSEMFTCFELDYKQEGFIQGAKEILELNKDKLFTAEDMRTAMLNAIEMTDFQKEQFRKDNDYHITLDIIQSLKQPTEIDVEIVMDRIPADLAPGGWDVFPKLDENNCLILKRVV